MEPTYRYFGLAECGRHIQVFGNEHVTEIVPIFHAPNGQPVDVVDCQISGQLDFNIFALVSA